MKNIGNILLYNKLITFIFQHRDISNGIRISVLSFLILLFLLTGCNSKETNLNEIDSQRVDSLIRVLEINDRTILVKFGYDAVTAIKTSEGIVVVDAGISTSLTDPLFNCTQITNEAGEVDYPFYWSSTTHANMTTGSDGGWGAYVCFGHAMGNEPAMPGGVATGTNWTDVHGAGAQRSDPKDGDPGVYSSGHGPQGDAVRILNYVRLVRNK